jgi:hypothetical protein
MSKPLSMAAVAALNEVLLQAAIRAERENASRHSDNRARELARRQDEIARAG